MKKKRHKEKPLISLLIAIGCVLLALLFSQTPAMIDVEYNLRDYRFQLRGPLNIEDSPIVILAIDDQSDESTPSRWPWPRRYLAHVIENLNEAGVKAIGVDVILEQADSHGTVSDDSLAMMLDRYDNVVMVGKILQTRGRFSSTIIVPPFEKFVRAGTPWGLVSSEVDHDGFYRRYLVGYAMEDTIYSSFAVEMLKIAKDIPRNTPLKEDEDNYYIGDYAIPKYDNYSMLINYYGPAGTFQKYSFDNVLDDADFDLLLDYDLDVFDDPGDPELGLPPGLLYSGELKDKIVLIGSTMQELHDDFPTPFLESIDADGNPVKSLTPGVEIHANALQTILSQNYIKELPYGWFFLIITILAIFIYLASHYLPTLWGAVVTLVSVVLYFVFAVYLFTNHNLFVDVPAPTLVILFSFVGHTLYQYVLSLQEKKMIQGAFSHYVPEKVVHEILENPDKLQLGGEERVVSVLFSDVAGFTSISEKLSPAELVHLLNDYLTEMTELILANNGIIDKYEGDAIMAEFGVPVHYDDHPIMACKAALEMQTKLKVLRTRWEKEGKPHITARIGINTGEVIVGNMGSKNVFDYTVMGDHVNLGARLESANKFFGTDIMIS